MAATVREREYPHIATDHDTKRGRCPCDFCFVAVRSPPVGTHDTKSLRCVCVMCRANRNAFNQCQDKSPAPPTMPMIGEATMRGHVNIGTGHDIGIRPEGWVCLCDPCIAAVCSPPVSGTHDTVEARCMCGKCRRRREDYNRAHAPAECDMDISTYHDISAFTGRCLCEDCVAAIRSTPNGKHDTPRFRCMCIECRAQRCPPAIAEKKEKERVVASILGNGIEPVSYAPEWRKIGFGGDPNRTWTAMGDGADKLFGPEWTIAVWRDMCTSHDKTRGEDCPCADCTVARMAPAITAHDCDAYRCVCNDCVPVRDQARDRRADKIREFYTSLSARRSQQEMDVIKRIKTAHDAGGVRPCMCDDCLAATQMAPLEHDTETYRCMCPPCVAKRRSTVEKLFTPPAVVEPSPLLTQPRPAATATPPPLALATSTAAPVITTNHFGATVVNEEIVVRSPAFANTTPVSVVKSVSPSYSATTTTTAGGVTEIVIEKKEIVAPTEKKPLPAGAFGPDSCSICSFGPGVDAVKATPRERINCTRCADKNLSCHPQCLSAYARRHWATCIVKSPCKCDELFTTPCPGACGTLLPVRVEPSSREALWTSARDWFLNTADGNGLVLCVYVIMLAIWAITSLVMPIVIAERLTPVVLLAAVTFIGVVAANQFVVPRLRRPIDETVFWVGGVCALARLIVVAVMLFNTGATPVSTARLAIGLGMHYIVGRDQVLYVLDMATRRMGNLHME